MPFPSNQYGELCDGCGEEANAENGDLSNWEELTRELDDEDYFDDRQQASDDHQNRIHGQPASVNSSPYASAQPLMTMTHRQTDAGFVSAFVIIDPQNPEFCLLPLQRLSYKPPGSDQTISAVWGPVVLPSYLMSGAQHSEAVASQQHQQQQPQQQQLQRQLQLQPLGLQTVGGPEIAVTRMSPDPMTLASTTMVWQDHRLLQQGSTSYFEELQPRPQTESDESSVRSQFLESTVEPLEDTLNFPLPPASISRYFGGRVHPGTATSITTETSKVPPPAAKRAQQQKPASKRKEKRTKLIRTSVDNGDDESRRQSSTATPKTLKPLTAYNYFFRDERDNIVDNVDSTQLPLPVSDFSPQKQQRLLHQHW